MAKFIFRFGRLTKKEEKEFAELSKKTIIDMTDEEWERCIYLDLKAIGEFG